MILDKIIEMSENDMRKSIIYLEIFSKIPYNILSELDIKNLSGEINEKTFYEILKTNNFDKITSFLKNYSYNEIQKILFTMVLEIEIETQQDMFLLLSDFDKHKNNKMDIDIFLMRFFSLYDIDII